MKRPSSPQPLHNSRVLPCIPGHILRGFILVLGDHSNPGLNSELALRGTPPVSTHVPLQGGELSV